MTPLSSKHFLFVAGLAAATPATLANAAPPPANNDGVPTSLFLEGTVRDFRASHPDFESYPGTYNKPAATLDADGKPLLDLDYYDLMRGTSAQSVHSPESFAQWWRNDASEKISKTLSHTIELERVDDRGVYRFARERSCLLYTSPSPRDRQKSRMPSSA